MNEYCMWDEKTKEWRERKQGYHKPLFSRIRWHDVSCGETHCLRMLLQRVPVTCDWVNLLKIDGSSTSLHDSYEEACKGRLSSEDDVIWIETVKEANNLSLP